MSPDPAPRNPARSTDGSRSGGRDMWPIGEDPPASVPAPPHAPKPALPSEVATAGPRRGARLLLAVAGVALVAAGVYSIARKGARTSASPLAGNPSPPSGTSQVLGSPDAGAGSPATPAGDASFSVRAGQPRPAARAWRFFVRSPEGRARDAEEIATLASARGSAASGPPSLTVVALAGGESPPSGDDVLGLVESGGAGIRLVTAAAAPLDDLERPDALVPTRFAGETFTGVRLPMRPDARAKAAYALALLVAQDPAGARDALADAPDDMGVRVLRAYVAACVGDFAPAHAFVKGLDGDPDVGAIARFVVGMALFGDGETRESARDFGAAASLRTGFWPATLYLAAANHRMGLGEDALRGYDAVLALVPGRVEAMLGRAACLARTDRRAALETLERLARDHPDLAVAWSRLAAWYRDDDRPGSDEAEIRALERYTALRPRDREAWERLATSRWERGKMGASAAFGTAADAFARVVALSKGPAAAVATYSRGAVLHQWALLPPPDFVVHEARGRLAEAQAAYESALALGLSGSVAAQAHFNRGLAIDLVASSDPSGGGARRAVPPEAIEAFEAARTADEGYAPPALALVAARIAARDAEGAAKAIAALPTVVSESQRALLSVAATALAGIDSEVRAGLGAPAAVPPEEDAIARLAAWLTEAGYGRVSLAILAPEPVARLVERVRADARLWDAASTKADYARLQKLDATAAAELRASDAVVRVMLAP